MDIRDILAQLDEIDLREAEESDIAAQQQANKEKVDFVKKQEYLYSLLKQLRALTDKTQMEESKISISKGLVESFGYQFDNKQSINEDILTEGWKETFLSLTKSSIGPVLRKIGLRFDFLRRIISGYEEIKAIPESMPLEQKHATISKIIGDLAGEYGLIVVGSIIGGFVTAPGGPLASAIGSAVGALYTTWKWGDDVDAFVTDLIKTMYDTVEPTGAPSTTTEPETTAQSGKEKSSSYDPEVEKIQQALVAKGAKITVDGILGPETFKAFDQYGDSLKESVSVSASIRYLQNRLALIENDPNEVNNFYDEYAFNEEANEESGKKKFMAKYPELAKRLGVTITPLEPATPEPPTTLQAPASTQAPEKTVGGAAKPVSEPTPAAEPQTSTAPSSGVGVAPFARLDAKSRLDAMSLVKQIKLAIQDMQKVPPSVQGDARKAIDHAQKTLQIYAPGMV